MHVVVVDGVIVGGVACRKYWIYSGAIYWIYSGVIRGIFSVRLPCGCNRPVPVLETFQNVVFRSKMAFIRTEASELQARALFPRDEISAPPGSNLQENGAFLSFSYVCPEPVLVK